MNTTQLKITKIEKLNTHFDLYDIETKNHNFYANNILVHNSNSAVCYSIPDGFWVQSRKNIITPEKDNAGCAFTAESNKYEWLKIINILAEYYEIDLNKNIITIYYEWCGGNIQKNSAASGLDKMSVIFKYFKVSSIDSPENYQAKSENYQAKWYETNITNMSVHCDSEWVSENTSNIYNIMDFPTYEVKIDFENPKMSQNEMIDIVEKIIEPNSPFGKQFGKESNTGEGIVMSFMLNGELLQFKIKGEKHAKSKVKILNRVDNIKLQKIQDIAQQVTPAWRLEQMYIEANDIQNGGIPETKNIGTFMKLLNKDIIKEESDIIIDAGLIPKEVFGSISKIARIWFFEQLDKEVIK